MCHYYAYHKNGERRFQTEVEAQEQARELRANSCTKRTWEERYGAYHSLNLYRRRRGVNRRRARGRGGSALEEVGMSTAGARCGGPHPLPLSIATPGPLRFPPSILDK